LRIWAEFINFVIPINNGTKYRCLPVAWIEIMLKLKPLKHYLLMEHDSHLSSEQLKKLAGKTLREKRLAKNYSMAAVAAELGMSKSTLCEIENGVYNFKIDMLERIAGYYGLGMDDILPPRKHE
jgi:DNA-binding XRE family transcriptional regulator